MITLRSPTGRARLYQPCPGQWQVELLGRMQKLPKALARLKKKPWILPQKGCEDEFAAMKDVHSDLDWNVWTRTDHLLSANTHLERYGSL